eukprot:scaffold41537_cov206-Amphora_coffeaeformis.AAC.1
MYGPYEVRVRHNLICHSSFALHTTDTLEEDLERWGIWIDKTANWQTGTVWYCHERNDPSYDSILEYAAKRKIYDAVRFLLEKGADPNTINSRGVFVFFHLLERQDMASLFLQHGGDLTVFNRYGKTVLHLACGMGYHEFVKRALKSGADCTVRAPRDDGMTLVHFAVTGEDDAKILEVMLEHGVDILHTRTNFGFTPFALAVGRQ